MSARELDYVDFCYVPQHQEAMHARMNNWARWVRVRPHGCQTHAMWRNAKTPRQWDVEPHISTALDTLDALLIERTVSKLPAHIRDALRWFYVVKTNPARAARKHGASLAVLAEDVIRGRTMVSNLALGKVPSCNAINLV